jgi:hypothetical protein
VIEVATTVEMKAEKTVLKKVAKMVGLKVGSSVA